MEEVVHFVLDQQLKEDREEILFLRDYVLYVENVLLEDESQYLHYLHPPQSYFRITPGIYLQLLTTLQNKSVEQLLEAGYDVLVLWKHEWHVGKIC